MEDWWCEKKKMNKLQFWEFFIHFEAKSFATFYSGGIQKRQTITISLFDFEFDRRGKLT